MLSSCGAFVTWIFSHRQMSYHRRSEHLQDTDGLLIFLLQVRNILPCGYSFPILLWARLLLLSLPVSFFAWFFRLSAARCHRGGGLLIADLYIFWPVYLSLFKGSIRAPYGDLIWTWFMYTRCYMMKPSIYPIHDLVGETIFLCNWIRHAVIYFSYLQIQLGVTIIVSLPSGSWINS